MIFLLVLVRASRVQVAGEVGALAAVILLVVWAFFFYVRQVPR